MFSDLTESLKSFDRSLERLPSSFVEKIVFWATWPETPVTRQAIETDLGYIRTEGEQVINALVQLLASRRLHSEDLISDIQRRQRIFRAALAHGATKQSVRDAYIVEYGALECFVLPEWLSAMKKRFADSSVSQAAVAYTEAVDRIQAEGTRGGVQDLPSTGVSQEVFGALLWGQGNSLVRSAATAHGTDARLAILKGFMALQAASMVFKPDRFPLTYAKFIPDWEAAKRAVAGK